jgi:hypothetical protein
MISGEAKTILERLAFGRGNAKLDGHIATFSMPAGWTCPMAFDCKATADRATGKITDGPHATIRCFSASAEGAFPSVRKSRWRNFDLLKSAKTTKGMADLILASLPTWATAVRIHVSGDFFNLAYFQAWRSVAISRPDLLFYAYTKSANFLPNRSDMPANFRVTISDGTRADIAAAREKGYFVATVVFTTATDLPIDHDDSHAMEATHDFALLLHGTQAKGTEAAAALKVLRAEGHKGYSN